MSIAWRRVGLRGAALLGRTDEQTEVLVLRIEGVKNAFRWELRRFGHGLPIASSARSFRSELEARREGYRALAELRAQPQPIIVS